MKPVTVILIVLGAVLLTLALADKTPRTNPGAINQDAADRFTFAHGAAGWAMQRFGFGMPATAAMAVGWELIENPLKDALPSVFPNASHDTPKNAATDVGAALAGWALAGVA